MVKYLETAVIYPRMVLAISQLLISIPAGELGRATEIAPMI